jgi:Xaa-Pro dipeptidase
MAEGALNRDRASVLMADAGLDALVAASPEHVYYATGYRPWVANLYRRAGYGGVVIPRDPSAPAGITITDVEADHFRRAVGERVPLVRVFPFWIAYAHVDPDNVESDLAGALSSAAREQPTMRSGQVDRQSTTHELAKLLREMGLGERSRVGVELPFTGADVLGWLHDALPTVEWLDATGLFAELRMIKSPMEIAWLHIATELTESAIAATLADLHAGLSARHIVHRYQRAMLDDPRIDELGLDIGVQRLSLRCGRNVLSAEAYAAHALSAGDLLFLDAGVEVNGYRSDMGRTAAFVSASPAARRVYDALRRGQEAVRALLVPGTPLAELFQAGMRAVHNAGFQQYVRGNIGHGIGLDPQPELPIVAREDTHVLSPDMVVSIEFPYYIHGLGAFQIEDTYLITTTGAEQWTHLPDELILVSPAAPSVRSALAS